MVVTALNIIKGTCIFTLPKKLFNLATVIKMNTRSKFLNTLDFYESVFVGVTPELAPFSQAAAHPLKENSDVLPTEGETMTL